MPLITNQKTPVAGSSAYGLPDISKIPSLIGLFDFHPDFLELDANGKIIAINEATGKGIRLPAYAKNVPPDVAATLDGASGYERGVWPAPSGAGASFGPLAMPNATTVTAAIVLSRPSKPPAGTEYVIGWGSDKNCLTVTFTPRFSALWRGTVGWTQAHTAYCDNKPEFMIFRGDDTRASIITETTNEELAAPAATPTMGSMNIGWVGTDPSGGSAWRSGSIYAVAVFSSYLAAGSNDLLLLQEWCKAMTLTR